MPARRVYFDNMASTRVDPRVVEEMIPHLRGIFGNPLNVHDWGQASSDAIEAAREKVAGLIGASPAEIIFNSCGSESNNLAVRGLAKAYAKAGKHIITSAIEHFSVLYPLKQLEKEGFQITYLPVDGQGTVDPKAVEEAITPGTVLVTITHASNEIGTIEPIKEIGQKVKEKGIAFHVDAVQTAGTMPLSVSDLCADALSLSANQFYGPTGVAALYLRKGIRIIPFLLGGTQEEGRRAGTQNIPGIVGMGRAAELAKLEMTDRVGRMVLLRERMLSGLKESISDFFVTGHPEHRLPNHASGCVKFIEGEAMSMFLNMEGIAVSTGSACVSKALKASHVLLAIGVSAENVHGSLVFSPGKDSVMEDVEYVLEKLPPIVERLRSLSPLTREKAGG
jgi:cysteine desulfurase